MSFEATIGNGVTSMSSEDYPQSFKLEVLNGFNWFIQRILRIYVHTSILNTKDCLKIIGKMRRSVWVAFGDIEIAPSISRSFQMKNPNS